MTFLNKIYLLLWCMKKSFTIGVFLLIQSFTFSQEFKERYESIDVKSYSIDISLSDSSNEIRVTEKIEILFLKNTTSFYLDLVDQGADKKGMKISKLLENNSEISFNHSFSKITINPSAVKANETRTYAITYSGIPKDGLVISKNKFGDRTFFGDNWPTRARNWIASVDHPSDKATVSWEVDVPNHYKVVANGEFKSEINLPNNRKKVSYYSATAIPTKVMVIGVAQFSVEQSGSVNSIPVSSWIYPQNEKEGFYDYALATIILEYFITHIGDYSYEKLANVQSTTRYGGMENASCIFYDEKSVKGNRSCEPLLAHEIAHQWFGNAASEMDWPHLWLSEGFATYFTNLYLEEKKGKEVFIAQEISDRKEIVDFYKNNKTPVIDTISTDLMYRLNPNSYQKGGWVLHMLRRKIGDELFWKGIMLYYATYKLSNATSNDFIAIMEKTSGMELSSFFDQWLRKSGHPEINFESKKNKKDVTIDLKQVQSSDVVFSFPLEIKIQYKDDSFEINTVEINQKNQSFIFPISKKIKLITLDPNTNLLFEEVK